MDSDTTTRPDRRSRLAVIGLPLAAMLAVGLALVLDAGSADAATVTVQAGQSLSQVAAQVHTSVAALAGANGISNPNVVQAGTVLQIPGTATASTAAPTASAPGAATTVTVQPGQTLSALAAHYGLSASALAAANGISNPDLIVAGSVLRIPGAGSPTVATPAPAPAPAPSFITVQVQPGQTLSAIAARYGTTAAALAAANKISNPNQIDAGTVLHVPGAAANPAGAGAGTVTMVGSVTVRSGDTLSSIAAHYGTTAGALAAANKISNPNMVFAGMRLTLPAAAAVVSSTSGAVATGNYPTALLGFPSRLALQPDFVHAAAASGVPVSLLEALCWWESGWQTSAVSATGALGVCQILPSTAAFVSSSILQGPALDPRVAADNIDLAAAYLRYLLNSNGGNAAKALAGYSQGMASIAQHGLLPGTQTYVSGILAYAAIFAGHG